MKAPKSSDDKARALLRILLPAFVLACLVPILLAQAPTWWTTRGVVIPGATPNDFSAATQGQLKNIATAAVAEFAARYSGTGPALNALNALNASLSSTSSSTSDFSSLNNGELKAVAKPFYDRLIEVGYRLRYPWDISGKPPNDFAAVNNGQIKNLFNFNFAAVSPTTDSDGDGIPDWWEMYYFGHLLGTAGANAIDPDTGISYLEDYLQGRTPGKPYITEAPGTIGGAVALQVYTPLHFHGPW